MKIVAAYESDTIMNGRRGLDFPYPVKGESAQPGVYFGSFGHEFPLQSIEAGDAFSIISTSAIQATSKDSVR